MDSKQTAPSEDEPVDETGKHQRHTTAQRRAVKRQQRASQMRRRVRKQDHVQKHQQRRAQSMIARRPTIKRPRLKELVPLVGCDVINEFVRMRSIDRKAAQEYLDREVSVKKRERQGVAGRRTMKEKRLRDKLDRDR